MAEQPRPATAAPPRYQGRAAVAAMLGVTPDLLAHWMRRHPGYPGPDADAEETGGRLVPLWLPGRDAEWNAWRAAFAGRTGRPRTKDPPEASPM
jgi:hypothetical protein